MPFEGLARSHSAEFIAAQRARTRSQSRVNNGLASPTGLASEAEVYIPSSSPALFISPSPVPPVLQRHEWPSYREKRSSSASSARNSITGGSFPRRTLSRISRHTAAIDEVANENEAAEAAANAAAITQPSRRPSESSSRTLGANGDETTDRDTQPDVVEPLKSKAFRGHSETEKDLEKGRNQDGDVAAVEEDGEGQRPTRKSTTQRQKEFDEQFLVSLKGREHLNPHTWSTTYRWFITGLMGLFVLNATFASSGPSQLLPSIVTYFGISQTAGVLTIALFVAGYCVGPLLWGPLSERFGRKIVFIAAFFPYTCFQVGCALAPNIGALLAFRFLGGCFAASPLTNSGGVIADLWDADKRGIALAIFSLAPFAGPAIAPIVSGALQVTGSDWRWIFWILTIFAGICLAIIIFVVPETYVPYLLHKEAKRLRKETGDDRWHTAQEHPDHKVTLKETLNHTILKPFIMFFQEPMLMVLTLYLAFVYGIVYLLFEAIPIIFQEYRGWNALEGGLAFLGLPLGGVLAVFVYAFYFNKVYMRKHHALQGKMVPPEERLKPLMVAAPAFAISFFWIGWTYYPSIHPISPLLAIILMGFAILFMFLSIFNYLIDSYLASAASALAINTVVRSTFGAGFPLFASQMYSRLGVPGASSLLGGLALVFLPAPFLLYKYGRKIRSLSKNAMVLDE